MGPSVKRKSMYRALLILLLVGCDDSAPARDTVDGGDDGGVQAADAAPPPGQIAADDATPPRPDGGDEACAPRGRIDPRPGLAGLVPRRRLFAGGPPGPAALWVGDVDGDPDGTEELVVVRGGRVEAYGADASLWWRSGVLGAITLAGVEDLDGDGRREVVAVSVRDVSVLDALTGTLLWSLPDPLFGDDGPLSLVRRALLVDTDADGLRDLYVADGGCSQDGRGHGVVVRFGAGVGLARPSTVVAGPRAGGRCATWHTVSEVDGRLALLITDGQGLNAFDLRTGERTLCGDLPGTPAGGRLPHRAFGPDRLVFDGGRVMRVAATDGPTERCDTARVLTDIWDIDLGGTVQIAGTMVGDLNEDRQPDVLTSYFDGAAWRVVGLSGVDGARLLEIRDVRLVGHFPDGRLLVRRGDPERPPRRGRLEILADGEVVYGEDDGRSMARAPAATDADRTREFAQPLRVGDRLVVAVGDADSEHAVLLGSDGAVSALGGASPGAVVPAAEGVVVAARGGEIVGFGPPARPLQVPTGAPSFALGPGPTLLAWSPSGVLYALDPQLGETRWWSEPGQSLRPNAPPLVHRDVVVVRDTRLGPHTWTGLDVATGELRWRYDMEPSGPPVRDPVLLDGVAVFHGVAGADEIPAEDRRCAAHVRNADDLVAPDPACPERALYVRTFIGLDAQTGACRWQNLMRSNTACGSPSNQVPSVAGGALYVTESNAVRRLDPATGEIVATLDNGRHAGGSPRGGGWIRATGGDPPLVRVGGNGPPEGLTADLGLAWRASEPEQRLQAWVVRDAAATGTTLWTAPARGLPLHRYALATGALRGALDGVGDQVSVQRVRDGGRFPVLAVTDDARLFALDGDGEVMWSRRFPAAVGQASVVDVDADAADELVVATHDGELVVLDQVALAAPEQAWALPCPVTARCRPDTEVATSPRTDALCAEFVPVPGAEGYEARLVGGFDGVVRDWVAVQGTTVTFRDLRLVPGAIYRVHVRAVRGAERSPTTSTNGVRIVNDRPPEVTVTPRSPRFDVRGEPLVVVVDAADDDLLAGWQLAVLDDDGDVVRTLARAALAHPTFTARRDWDGRRDDGARVVPGAYRLRARFTDRARNETTAMAEVAVCEGPCP